MVEMVWITLKSYAQHVIRLQALTVQLEILHWRLVKTQRTKPLREQIINVNVHASEAVTNISNINNS